MIRNLIVFLVVQLLIYSCAQVSLPIENNRWNLQRVAASSDFSGRDMQECISYKGYIYLSHGWTNDNTTYNDLWRSADGKKWEQVLENTPYDLFADLVSYNGKVYAIKESVWVTEDMLMWVKISNSTPMVETLSSVSFPWPQFREVLVFNNEIYALADGTANVFKTKNGIDWDLVTSKAGYGARGMASIVATSGYIYLVGGTIAGNNNIPNATYPLFKTYSDVWRSSDGENWELIADGLPFGERMWSNVAIFDKKIVLIAGYSNIYNYDYQTIWTSTDGIMWEVCPFEIPSRHEAGVVVFNDSLFIIGGFNLPNVRNDVWVITKNMN